MTLKTRDIGLAAYLKIKGTKLLKCEERMLYFETDRTLEDWRVQYYDSESRTHDAEVMAIRKLVAGE